MEFEVEAKITFDAMITVEANNEAEAKQIAEQDLLSYYHLDGWDWNRYKHLLNDKGQLLDDHIAQDNSMSIFVLNHCQRKMIDGKLYWWLSDKNYGL